jgi:hypothetical protein
MTSLITFSLSAPKHLLSGEPRASRHVRTSSMVRDCEWYTQPVNIEVARSVLGTTDSDPASSELANCPTQTTTYYMTKNDAMVLPWFANVWLNPPYGQEVGRFVRRLLTEHEQRHVTASMASLSPNSAYSGWFKPLCDYILCLAGYRMPFVILPGGQERFSRKRVGLCVPRLGAKALRKTVRSS